MNKSRVCEILYCLWRVSMLNSFIQDCKYVNTLIALAIPVQWTHKFVHSGHSMPFAGRVYTSITLKELNKKDKVIR